MTLKPIIAFLVLLLVVPMAQAAETVLEFKTFAGVPNPPVTIREIPGGGAAWTIARGEARLDEDGTLKVEVEGLVLVGTGTNPVARFMATLSCLDAQGVTRNLSTRSVLVGSDGNARIEEKLTLPATCLAPIVFVRAGLPTNMRWFAVSGF